MAAGTVATSDPESLVGMDFIKDASVGGSQASTRASTLYGTNFVGNDNFEEICPAAKGGLEIE